MLRRSFLCIILVAGIPPVWAGNAPYDTELVPGVALGGYDATSYVTGMPKQGDAAITQIWQGVTWRFASTESRAVFAAAPERYAPQYGGYCAFAAAKGSIAPGDPLAWTLHKNKLYINLSPEIRDTWSEDIDGNVAAADKNWPGLAGK